MNPYDCCRVIQREFGTSYFLATRLFDAPRRRATEALYAFFRVADEIVDTQDGARGLYERFGTAKCAIGLTPREGLEAWRSEYSSIASQDPVVLAARDTCARYAIPDDEITVFLHAMEQDISQDRYETYEDLRGYMYGSAMVVGRMMTRVIGFQDGAMSYADALGEAMQLTNFLRDVGEDWRDRARIYLPRDECMKYGISDEMIMRGERSDAWRVYMTHMIARADALFAKANQGIALLHVRGRFAVRVASALYQGILREIERYDMNVFSQRARVPWYRKILLIIRCVFV